MGTYADRLKLVQDAIDSILKTGQAITEDGKVLTQASLADLRGMEKDYTIRANREARAAGRGRNRIIYVTPQ